MDEAVFNSQPDVIMHTNSTYPCPVEDLNLRYLEHMKDKWGDTIEIGYSGHEYGLVTSYAAVAMGAPATAIQLTTSTAVLCERASVDALAPTR